MSQETIIFRTITPIYRFEISPETEEFTYQGAYKNSIYSVSLKNRPRTPEDFQEMTKYASDITRDTLAWDFDISKYGHTQYFLIIDVKQPNTGIEASSNTQESILVTNACIESIRIVSTNGLITEKTHEHRWPLHPRYLSGTTSDLVSAYIFCELLKKNSILESSKFDMCSQLIGVLLSDQWEQQTSFNKIMHLSRMYHKCLFSFSSVEHSYLSLMIIFEALFKRMDERNASNASVRISQLLSRDAVESENIKKAFFEKGSKDTFCQIRNYIAHGDAELSSKTVKTKIKPLYEYVTASMLRLLLDVNQAIDHRNNYYDELDSYLSKQ